MSITERLNERLAGQDVDRDAWSIQDHDGAAWASRKIRDAYREIEQVDAWEQREIERIREAAEAERKSPQRDIEWFQGHLHVYLNRLIEDGRKTKSLTLPGGKVRLHARQPKIDVADEAEAIAWLREHAPDSVRVKHEVNKTAFKKRVMVENNQVVDVETGEVLAWATGEVQEDSLTFSPAKDDEPAEGGDE